MRSTRGPWIRLVVTGLSVVAAPYWLPASPVHRVLAPTRSNRSTSSMSSLSTRISPVRLGVKVQAPRSPGGRDNQMQQYYNELEGASRLSSERFSPGLPYWKVRTNAERDRQERLNRRAERQSEDTPAAISQKYLAYFSEPNPRKRAILMREFTPVRRGDERDGLVRGENGADNRETALGLDPGRRSRARRSPSAVGGRAATRRGPVRKRAAEAFRLPLPLDDCPALRAELNVDRATSSTAPEALTTTHSIPGFRRSSAGIETDRLRTGPRTSEPVSQRSPPSDWRGRARKSLAR